MADQEPLLSASLAARYAVIETLGEGAMGVVYRAMQVSLDRPVALKVIRPQMLDADGRGRFLQEAKLAARINHPNVVQVYESGEDEGVPFIAFELVNGPSLRRVMDAGELEPSVAVQYVKQVAAGLCAAHEQGIIHRDVKPENILITRSGEAKVADFGISRPAHEDRPGLTAAGTILGSPLYMSPEQAANRLLTASTDQYSLGIVLYEMLVGRPPFEGATGEILAQHLRDTIALPPAVRARVPAHVVEVLEQMVRKDPSRRFPHARDLVATLEKALARWRGPRKSTIPTPRPRVPGFAREGSGSGSRPPLGSASSSGSGTAVLERRSFTEPADSPGASGARTGARSGSGAPQRVSSVPAQGSRLDDDFESEPLPVAVRAGLVFLILLSVSSIGYWLGRNERPVKVDRQTSPSAAPTPKRDHSDEDGQVHGWPAGTVIGNVESKIYHVVGETESKLPGRVRARKFNTTAEAEAQGYRRARR